MSYKKEHEAKEKEKQSLIMANEVSAQRSLRLFIRSVKEEFQNYFSFEECNVLVYIPKLK